MFDYILHDQISISHPCPSQVKSEGDRKRSAVNILSDANGDVRVTSKPASAFDLVPPDAKRSKSDEGEEEDVEMVGSAGAVVLPHNRFACTEVRL